MIERAKSDEQIDGVVPHLVDGGLSILQYADDTILFMEHDIEKAKNLKINFHKSELFCFGEAQDDISLYAELFGCGQGQSPIKYLGIPIHYRRLTIAEWKMVEERLQAKLNSWKGKLLSLGGRLVLINSVLSNMVLYMISFFQLPKGVLKNWIIFVRDSFGKVTVRRESTDWPSGVWFADPRTKEGLAFMT